MSEKQIKIQIYEDDIRRLEQEIILKNKKLIQLKQDLQIIRDMEEI